MVNSASTASLYKLSRSNFPQSATLFIKQDLRSVYSYTLKTIFKNDKVNGSIFEDGLTSYLSVTPLVAETWGRPIEKAWCGKGFEVVNAVTVNVGGISWNEQDDHSKWVLARNDYACFGDMNRMSSQWKRGGSFFCLSEPTLVAALKAVVTTHDNC